MDISRVAEWNLKWGREIFTVQCSDEKDPFYEKFSLKVETWKVKLKKVLRSAIYGNCLNK